MSKIYFTHFCVVVFKFTQNCVLQMPVIYIRGSLKGFQLVPESDKITLTNTCSFPGIPASLANVTGVFC